jgi:ACT domain-containing protein
VSPPPGRHIVISVRLPNRPGALGSVASRIGAVGANITDVSVSRADDQAVDEFHLDLPDAGAIDTVAVLIDELGEVDGARIDHWYDGGDGCCSR